MDTNRKRNWLFLLAALLPAMLVLPVASYSHPLSQVSRTFPETGKTVKGLFLGYWDSHGALPQQGYPVTEEMQEKSPTDGKVYTMQYFERAIFEMHPENKPPYDVLLSLLGNFTYKQKYPSGAPNQKVSTEAGGQKFTQTGHTVGGIFLKYWNEHGGLPQQGYPISDEFQEKSDLDGKTYTVQYFERAVFEKHPENKPPYDVLLSQLGTFRLKALRGDAKGVTRILVQHEGLTRPIIIFIPHSYDAGKAVPLMTVHHGGHGNGNDFFEATPDIQAAAQREGFIVIYPTGLPEAGSDNPKNAVWEDPRNDRYIPFLMDYAQTNYSIDIKRIYSVGFSGGAKLAFRLAADPVTSKRIAAIGTVAGDFQTHDRTTGEAALIDMQKSGGTPMSAFLTQGEKDTKDPIGGGLDEEGDYKVPFQTKVDQWTKFLSLSGAGQTVTVPGAPTRVKATRWTNPTTKYALETLVDPVLAHKWPEWDLMTGMWDFFKSVPTR
jgi:poly(3-hydroxybutyrate) depolymerase